jgi:hypothetical protein
LQSVAESLPLLGNRASNEDKLNGNEYSNVR